MKTLAFDKASWHYRLASVYAGYDPRQYSENDFCRYVKYVIGGVFAIIIGLFGFTGVAIALVDVIMSIAFLLMYGMEMMSLFSQVTLFILLLGSTIGGTVYVVVGWLQRRDERRRYEERKPDGFIRTAYNSWREKYCLRVEFTEKEESKD